MTYLCPLCQSTLRHEQRSYVCHQRHQFDVAKEGYVNLLPVQHKRSKDPGDNKEMMQARRQFLETGYYHRLRQSIGDELLRYPIQSLLDIGCGEGYYTDYFRQTLSQTESEISVHGLDISKIAIRYAAKAYPETHFCVASSQRLPFADNSLDAIVRIYAPCKADELTRVLSSNGVIITVTPAARHLFQLKSLIYQNVVLHDEDPEAIDGFELINQQTLHYTMNLPGADAFSLLQMTPFAWRATAEIKDTVSACREFECEAHFMLRTYKKQPPLR
jgi:23S rRNA (guanine745-N1)-methyltransferase